MKHLFIATIIGSVLLPAFAQTNEPRSRPVLTIKDMVRDEIKNPSEQRLIVKYKEPTLYRAMTSYDPQQPKSTSRSATSQLSQRAVTAFRSAGVRLQRTHSAGVSTVKVSAGKSIVKAKQALLDTGLFESVRIEQKRYPFGTSSSYNDPRFAFYQRYFAPNTDSPLGMNISGMKALASNNMGRKIRIGVIDSGLMLAPDQPYSSTEGYDFLSGYESDTTSNLGDNGGRDSDPTDVGFDDYGSCYNGHGSMVAGTIVAHSNNGYGYTGILDSVDAEVVHARVFPCRGSASPMDIVDAITWLSGGHVPDIPDIETPVDIINMSLGGYGECTEEEQESISAAVSRGVAVVVAAGNESDNSSDYAPGNCKGIITVGALSSNRKDKLGFSNFGSNVDVSVQGEEIQSSVSKASTIGSWDDSVFVSWSGTSSSAPVVAGMLGNVLMTYPNMKPHQLYGLIRETGSKFPDDSVCSELDCGVFPNGLAMMQQASSYTGYHAYTVGHYLKEDERDDVIKDLLVDNSGACDFYNVSLGNRETEVEGVTYQLTNTLSEINQARTFESPFQLLQFNDSHQWSFAICEDDQCSDTTPINVATIETFATCNAL